MLDTLDSAFRRLWEFRYILERSKVVVASVLHAVRLAGNQVVQQSHRSARLISQFETKQGAPAFPKDFELDVRYLVSIEALKAKDREFLTAITATISNRIRREGY